MRKTLRQSWHIYRQNFLAVAALVFLVWTPLELFSCYMDVHVFGEDFIRSVKFHNLLESFIGVIGIAGIISIAHNALLDRPTTWSGALAVGFQTWARQWWTRLLWYLTVTIGFICLIIPGIYLLVRLSFVDQVVTVEKLSGMQAFARSFELTENRFWPLFRLAWAVVGLMVISLVMVILPPYLMLAILSETSYEFLIEWILLLPNSLIATLLPLLNFLLSLPVLADTVANHWLFDTFMAVITALVVAYWYVAFTVIYHQYQQDQLMPAPAGPILSPAPSAPSETPLT
jgi:hypothetical protein